MLMRWVRPSGVIARLRDFGGDKDLQWVGVAGLGLVPGPPARKAIHWLSGRAGEELHQHCMRTLVRRRREDVSEDE
jgi:hypothetical protein